MTVFPSRELDNGRCCGRKPTFYKTARGLKGLKDPHHFCHRCCAEYSSDGKQRANWAWLAVEGGFEPKYPGSDYEFRAIRSRGQQ